MVPIYANLSLSNPVLKILTKINVKALVDTGAATLCIPEHINIQLEFEELEKREVTTTDGNRHLVPYVGPVKISYKNRYCYTGAFVQGDEVLMGAVPIEDMDLVLIPLKQTVDVNPESPNIPSAIVK